MTTENPIASDTRTRSTIPVRVLSTAGCANATPAVSLVEDTARELGVDIVLSQLVLASPEQAAQSLFYGSPTVQVDGVDIDPSMRGSQAFGFT